MAGRRTIQKDTQNRDIRTRLRSWAHILVESGSRPKFRLFVFACVAGLWLGLIVVRLWDLQIRQAPRLVEQAKGQHEDLIEIGARRGRIYDRFGEELARSTPVDSIGVFPRKIGDPDLAAELLAEVLGEDVATLRAKLTRKGFQWVRRLAEPGEAERLRELKITGLHFEKESKRYYPKGSVAAHILGAVGIDHTGLAGLEQTFESKLQGVPGQREIQVDALRKGYESRVIQEPVPGYDLELTIDQRIQITVERELARAVHETKAEAGTIVVMDPSNGDLLGLANWPTFDPNDRSPTVEDLKRRKNYALSHMIEPGSTFKVVTVSASLEEGLTTPEEIIDCEHGRIYLGSRRIRDHKPFGLLTVADVLARSSNVGTIKLGLRLTPERLYNYARRFGIGQATGLPLPGEVEGMLRKWEDWHPHAIGSVSIGQEVGVSAVQMARAISVVANGGLLVKPRVVKAVVSPDGVREEREPVAPERVLGAETAATMRALMERVARGGTAVRAQTPGYRVAGKTGTAQKIDPETRRYSTEDYVASFVGFAPVNSPSILVVVVLDSPVGPYYGGLVAAPVFPRIATEVLRFRDVPPELPLENAPKPIMPDELLADFASDDDDEGWPEAMQVRFASDNGDANAVALAASARTASVSPLLGARSPRTDEPVNSPLPEPVDWPDAAARVPSEHTDSDSTKPARLRVVAGRLPDFRDQTVASVISRSNALGLAVQLRGNGKAWRQWPAPNTPIQRGDTVAVDFRVGAKQ